MFNLRDRPDAAGLRCVLWLENRKNNECKPLNFLHSRTEQQIFSHSAAHPRRPSSHVYIERSALARQA